MIQDFRGVLWVVGEPPKKCVVWRKVGTEYFHVHTNALAVASWDNIQAGRKVSRVVVSEGHFRVVKDK